jgi:hypothetical protein
LCVGILAAFDLADAAPVDFERIAVLLGTGDFTTSATDTLRHVEVKPVLLGWAIWRQLE